MIPVEVLQPQYLKDILTRSSTIAIVGLSPRENRPSNMVGRYLLEAGYTIYPVNPGQDEILGQPCYPDLASLPVAVDIVDIFRKSEDIPGVIEAVLSLKVFPKTVWMQLGIVNHQAAELARKAGIEVVMDRCIKVDHQNLLGPAS
jgi:predicted CoA-binding protein